MKIDLSKRIAVVTGGAGQLGRVMVRTLAGCGADVAIHYRCSGEMAESLRDEVVGTGRRAVAVDADVTDAGSVLAMRDRIGEELGMPDTIVNNAVLQYVPWTPVIEQDVADYEGQFRTCVMHNVHMVKAFVPAMVERGFGRVIGINTECSMQCFPTQSAYVAGKRGMDGVLRVLAKEVGPSGVTVNQVAPGWTVSDRHRDEKTESQPEYEKNVPLRRRGTDQEIANAVAFLASDLAAFITGAFIPVCGGNVMPTI